MSNNKNQWEGIMNRKIEPFDIPEVFIKAYSFCLFDRRIAILIRVDEHSDDSIEIISDFISNIGIHCDYDYKNYEKAKKNTIYKLEKLINKNLSYELFDNLFKDSSLKIKYQSHFLEIEQYKVVEYIKLEFKKKKREINIKKIFN